MVNLFGLVSTNRKALKHHPDPVGPDTDSHIRRIATLIPTIFVAWGTDGRHQNRGQEVMRLLAQLGRRGPSMFWHQQRWLTSPPTLSLECDEAGFLPAADFVILAFEHDAPTRTSIGNACADYLQEGA